VGVRQFKRRSALTLLTVLVLGLGTGAATTVFTIVDAVVLEPLPYDAPDRLVTIWDTNATQALSHDPISPVNFMDQRALAVFADAAAWWRPGINLTDPGLDPVRVNTIETSGNLFDVLGVKPQVGVGFPASGPLFVRNELVAVISDRLWRSRYGSDPSIIGRQLRLNDTPYTVLGVMPPKFHFPDDVDVWQRLRWDMTQHSRQAHFMEAVARLSAGTTLAEAQSAVDALWIRLEREFGTSQNSPGQGWGSRLLPLLDEQLGYYRPALIVLFGAVGLLVLIGILNVASLQLTRLVSRDRELAVRIALGASPRQLFSELLAENLVLAFVGALAGLALTVVAVPAVAALTPIRIPRLDEAGVDLRALGLALAVAAAATVFFGLLPALSMRFGRVASDLKSGDRGSSRGARRVYSALVASEVALACALLVSSVLLVRTVRHMMEEPTGVRADRTLTTTVQLTRLDARPDIPLREQWRVVAETHSRILESIRQQPGVEAAGASNFLPFEIGWRGPFVLQGQPMPARLDDAPQAQLHSVSEGYFEAMGATLAAGRAFTPFDDADAPGVVMVNATFARRYLGDGVRVGQVLRLVATGIGPLGLNLKATQAQHPEGLPFEIVGIVGDVRNVPHGQAVEPAIYTSTRQFPFTDVFIAVLAADPGAAGRAVREALRSSAPGVPMGASETWGARLARRTAEPRLLMWILAVFGALAGLLAGLGVYSLFSWSVALQRRELAIRLTLGARPSEVGALIVRQSALLVGTGLVLGLAIVRLTEGALTRVLYEVLPTDVAATTTASALLLAAALVACLPPALRAMRVDPAEGLRAE
jgi:predicted permease